MDRTIIAPRKAEEKEQSEKLYVKLQGLGMLYPMNDELKPLVSKDMFIKPNQPAFLQVMAYLFRLHDSVEFKKRFYWPITSKKEEATFRSATVEYLKDLNEKHQLKFGDIKSYLVVMPGGLKFINFLSEFIGFVIREMCKTQEKSLRQSLGKDFDVLRKMPLKTMQKRNKLLKEAASSYVEDITENSALLKEKIQKMKGMISQMSNKTGVPVSVMMDESFIQNFEASNMQLIKERVTEPAARLAALEAPLCGLKEDMEQFQAKQLENSQAKESVNQALKVLGHSHQTESEGSKINALLSSFNKISETIAEQLDANDHYNESNEYVTKQLAELQLDLTQMQNQATEIQKSVNIRGKELHNNKNLPSDQTLEVPATPRINNLAAEHPFMLKYVSTPPIKLELPPNGSRNPQVRLPLQDDIVDANLQFEALSKTLVVPAPPRSARKGVNMDHTLDQSSATNRSKILDPMQLLRTINKKTSQSHTNPNQTMQPKSNLSSLGSKWKELQASFGFEETTPVSSSSLLGSHERTITEPTGDTNSSLMAKKSAAMMKVLDASLNVQNLSTSPSGRLDPLVPLPPRLQLNDFTITNSEPLEMDEKLNSPLNLSSNQQDFELQNISDSVLKDISM
ncbi:uncharacterized protein Dwil_GK11189 [Drosophila willistoni]|uniref:HAUS augmin-like complex subunit 6 N-terminal domain-containing protein n=1 Tax=Drosophila willistoni TaxID=7260 RepID=B4NBG1_DROWI|nr:augmin complex subunit dgt6 [Drosophila willistoni]EDW81125.1 uncharacterized protein Dwil_GK11189 [Drosophila willistoni]